jgi:hypothetical protein
MSTSDIVQPCGFPTYEIRLLARRIELSPTVSIGVTGS